MNIRTIAWIAVIIPMVTGLIAFIALCPPKVFLASVAMLSLTASLAWGLTTLTDRTRGFGPPNPPPPAPPRPTCCERK